jgi:hypothetical protein
MRVRFAVIGAVADARELATNLRDVIDQRNYLATNVPEWRSVAKQWSDFLKERTGHSLDAEPTEADRRSEAP